MVLPIFTYQYFAASNLKTDPTPNLLAMTIIHQFISNDRHSLRSNTF